MVEQLLLSGADIVKVGIGPGTEVQVLLVFEDDSSQCFTVEWLYFALG